MIIGKVLNTSSDKGSKRLKIIFLLILINQRNFTTAINRLFVHSGF